MRKQLSSIAKKLSGSVLLIGFGKEKIADILDKNEKLTIFSHLTDKNSEKGKRKFFGNKTINIKKLYKELGKGNYDYIICDFELVKAHLNNFIRNSYMMTNNEIYILVNEDRYDFEEIMRRYSRYGAICSYKSKNMEYLIKIDVTKMKMSILSRFIYRLRDTGYNIIEFISNVIIS